MRPIIILALLFLAGCADVPPPAPVACGFAGSSTLPLAQVGPFAAVDATVDGMPSRLVVDTGAGNTVLSAAAARRAGVSPDLQRLVRTTGIGGAATYPTGRIGRLKLGDFPVEPAVVLIMPAVPVADGNLGMDILGDADLDIDMPDGRVTLHYGRLCPRASPPWNVPATELRTAARLTPLPQPAGARPRQLLLLMELDGVPALALLDTGSGRSVVAHTFAARLGVTDAALASRPSLRLAGLSPQAGKGRPWQFHEARIGTERIEQPTMVVTELPDPGYDVLLGMDYLATHRVWLSYGARRIFVAAR